MHEEETKLKKLKAVYQENKPTVDDTFVELCSKHLTNRNCINCRSKLSQLKQDSRGSKHKRNKSATNALNDLIGDLDLLTIVEEQKVAPKPDLAASELEKTKEGPLDDQYSSSDDEDFFLR
jgi:hypothetical protein